MTRRSTMAFTLLVLVGARLAPAQEAADLRLVPFPKEVALGEGTFSLNANLVLEVPAGAGPLLGRMIGRELARAGRKIGEIRRVEGAGTLVRLAAAPGADRPSVAFREDATDEDYVLEVRPDEIVCAGRGRPGLFYGVQTLCQLIRANRRGEGLPCLSIRDWPSLRWRCFQDDMTRGPSSTLPTLRRQVALGAHLKMNLFTYYMEYQYAFQKHPKIGPKDGSLEPDDLRALVEFAKTFHVDVLGNQQSFGHFGRILAHDEYAHLRETPTLLCPVKEESYQLLDDLYSEVCPLLPFEMFNVCCDETWGLGEGPSKPLAEEIGVGGVYVGHIARVHDLLKKKYGKRMMMWGDIILKHPEHLPKIPKDTIMLTWGYGPKESFDDQIVPFADSGYEFFVCPGISNWSRILPDFGVATTNIHHFVRDGARLGALGMLNTAWEDDGEALQGYKWHGYAWGAECAWNASATTPDDFNRRIGAVLFGARGDRFGRAIDLLAQTHRMPGMQGMNNRRFWQHDFQPERSPAAIRKSADGLLGAVRPAIEHLEACQAESTLNGDLLDYFLFGARRMERIGRRMLDGLEAARLYTRACDAPPQEALALVERVERLVAENRDAHRDLGDRFRELWLAESKPYALDWTLDRYAAAVKRYDDLLAQLAEARQAAEAGRALPAPESLGLLVPEAFARRSRPAETVPAPLAPEAAWAEPSATHRVGMVVGAGSVERHDLPVAVALPLDEELAAKPVRAFCRLPGREPHEILAQLDPSDQPGRRRLVTILPGPIGRGAEAEVHVYLGLPAPPDPLAQAVGTHDGPDGAKWIENDRVRLLLGPEGAHVYRWEVKALDGRDLTMPGETGWSGFADLRAYRHVAHQLQCAADGPALVRYDCASGDGLVKSIALFGGVAWMEVVLSEPTGHYWDFDAPANFAAGGPTPGTYLFADGTTGAVREEGPFSQTQVKVRGVPWAVKFNDEGLALGLCTPETSAHFVVAPGAGSGGVGIENSPPAAHFVTFAGLLDAPPAETMTRLRATLDFRHPPHVVLHAIQKRE